MVVLGIVIGSVRGLVARASMARLYAQFFHFPVLLYRLDATVILIATIVCAGAAAAGAMQTVRRAVRLPPAEAMRPPAPTVYRRSFLSRLGVHRLISHTGRMTLRELERRPVRALFSAVGIAAGLAILVVGRFADDAMANMIDVQFDRAQRAELTVVFRQPVSSAAAARVGRLPGVLMAEPMRSVPVRIRAGHRSRDIAVLGLPPAAELRRVVDVKGRPVMVPERGILLTDELARRLDVRVGDEVTLELLEGDFRPRHVRITGLLDEMLGLNGYMELGALHRLLGEAPTTSALSLRVNPADLDALFARLRTYPAVASVQRREVILDSFESNGGDFTRMFTIIVVVFGAIIASGVVYNNARVAIAERGRELATLRVLGFTRGEISRIILAELGVHMLVALPIGLFLGNVLARAIMGTIDREQYRMPAVIAPQTYGFSALMVIGAAVLTALWMRRRLDRLDLIEALKARD